MKAIIILLLCLNPKVDPQLNPWPLFCVTDGQSTFGNSGPCVWIHFWTGSADQLCSFSARLVCNSCAKNFLGRISSILKFFPLLATVCCQLIFGNLSKLSEIHLVTASEFQLFPFSPSILLKLCAASNLFFISAFLAPKIQTKL